MKVNVISSGEMEIAIDGNVVKTTKYNSNYDGNELKISGSDNGTHFYKKLNNKDISNILSMPTSNLSLEERLNRDYKNIKGSKKHTKKKHTKKKHTKKTRKH